VRRTVIAALVVALGVGALAVVGILQPAVVGILQPAVVGILQPAPEVVSAESHAPPAPTSEVATILPEGAAAIAPTDFPDSVAVVAQPAPSQATPQPAAPAVASAPPAPDVVAAAPEVATIPPNDADAMDLLDSVAVVAQPTPSQATPQPAALAVASAPPAPPPMPAPTFDVVRINPQGEAVIAGRAAPGAEVTVRAGDEPVAVTRADSAGEFVVVPDAPLPGGAQELTLRAETLEGVVQSDQVLTVLVPAESAGPEEQPVAILQDREGAAPPRVLQGAVSGPDARADALRLDAVQYDEVGNVVFSGQASPDTEIRVFIDDVRAGGTVADADGFWHLAPEGVLDVGRHDLRLEQVEGGFTVARIALPFMRSKLMTALAPGEVIVQPGNSLWRIARATYGQGTLFTVIFLANAEQIDSPDLIFPGQVFTLPKTPQKH
jgi:nucleoid-associated protein YgaU